jgi:hypothetical protein
MPHMASFFVLNICMLKKYNNYPDYLKSLFPEKVRKIPLDAGFTCPTRDGSKSFGGCTYCNNDSFNPWYGRMNKSVTEQIEEGISFFSKKYRAESFLIYFQAYTNTYGDFEKMKKIYSMALSHPDVVGIIIGTRPDCVDEKILDYLSELAETNYVAVEYGIESTHNATLEFIKRGHTFEEAAIAVKNTHERKIITGAHIILYLPGETEEMMLETADRISELPIKTLKIHQLQIVKRTIMAKQFQDNPELFNLPDSEEYAGLVIRFLERLNPEIVIERFLSETPPDLIIAPQWSGLRHGEFIKKLGKLLLEQNTHQGKYFS